MQLVAIAVSFCRVHNPSLEATAVRGFSEFFAFFVVIGFLRRASACRSQNEHR